MSENETANEITISISEPLRISGARNFLLIDPEDRSIGTWSNVGFGVPRSVFNGRAIMMRLPEPYVPEMIEEYILGNLETFDDIFSTYQGAEWDGNNHVGRWENPESLAELEHEIEEDLLELPTYWDAADWLSGDYSGVIRNAISADSIDDAVNAEMDFAAGNAYLEESEVKATIRLWLAECLGDDQYEDDHAQIKKLLES